MPHLAKNQRDTPNFLHAAPDKVACAPFFKERRTRFAGPTKLLRKSGYGAPQALWKGKGTPKLLEQETWVRMPTRTPTGVGLLLVLPISPAVTIAAYNCGTSASRMHG